MRSCFIVHVLKYPSYRGKQVWPPMTSIRFVLPEIPAPNGRTVVVSRRNIRQRRPRTNCEEVKAIDGKSAQNGTTQTHFRLHHSLINQQTLDSLFTAVAVFCTFAISMKLKRCCQIWRGLAVVPSPTHTRHFNHIGVYMYENGSIKFNRPTRGHGSVCLTLGAKETPAFDKKTFITAKTSHNSERKQH